LKLIIGKLCFVFGNANTNTRPACKDVILELDSLSKDVEDLIASMTVSIKVKNYIKKT